MNNRQFESVLAQINQETHLTEKKLEILYGSNGLFNAQQAARIIYAFGISTDKLQAIELMAPRLTPMTCNEARDVLGAFSIHADKVKALHIIKRFLCDGQSQEGLEYILAAFTFEEDKIRAASILHTTAPPPEAAIPAGGHQGYAALGGLYTQSRPLVTNLYGDVNAPRNLVPGFGSTPPQRNTEPHSGWKTHLVQTTPLAYETTHGHDYQPW